MKSYETRYMNEVAVLRMLGINHTSVYCNDTTVKFVYTGDDLTLPVVRIGDLWVPRQNVQEMPTNAVQRDIGLSVLSGLIQSRQFFVEIVEFCEHLREVKKIIFASLREDLVEVA